jgi:hypoxanthine phosphoribosyltransferase
MKFVSKRSTRGSYSIHAYHDASVRLEYDADRRRWVILVPGDIKDTGNTLDYVLYRETYRNKKSALKVAHLLLNVLIEKRTIAQAKAFSTTLPPFRQANNRMSRSEALEVLGLTSNASKEEIEKKHRELTKGLHPDRGGSTFLMIQINLARDVLR